MGVTNFYQTAAHFVCGHWS